MKIDSSWYTRITDVPTREIFEETGIHSLEPLYSGVYATEEGYGFGKGIWIETSYFLYLTTQASGKPSDPKHTLVWASLEQILDLFWLE